MSSIEQREFDGVNRIVKTVGDWEISVQEVVQTPEYFGKFYVTRQDEVWEYLHSDGMMRGGCALTRHDPHGYFETVEDAEAAIAKYNELNKARRKEARYTRPFHAGNGQVD